MENIHRLKNIYKFSFIPTKKKCFEEQNVSIYQDLNFPRSGTVSPETDSVMFN